MEERRIGMFVGGRLKGRMIEAAVSRFSKPRAAPAGRPIRARLTRHRYHRHPAVAILNYSSTGRMIKKRPGAAQPIRVVHIW
jgi:hypothetical protein